MVEEETERTRSFILVRGWDSDDEVKAWGEKKGSRAGASGWERGSCVDKRGKRDGQKWTAPCLGHKRETPQANQRKERTELWGGKERKGLNWQMEESNGKKETSRTRGSLKKFRGRKENRGSEIQA